MNKIIKYAQLQTLYIKIEFCKKLNFLKIHDLYDYKLEISRYQKFDFGIVMI